MSPQFPQGGRQLHRDRPVQEIVNLLKFLLPSLPPSPPIASWGDHMGCLLADVSLQTALNYERVVAPRVQAVRQLRPSLTRTRDIASHLERVPAEKLLRWTGNDKPQRFRSLVDVCLSHGIDTVHDLHAWTTTDAAKGILLAIPGIGRKSYDYLRLLCGHDVFPIDRHYIRFMAVAGLDYRKHGYDGSQQLLNEACTMLNLQPRDIERGLWLLMKECG